MKHEIIIKGIEDLDRAAFERFGPHYHNFDL
jgi:hypothetical protein